MTFFLNVIMNDNNMNNNNNNNNQTIPVVETIAIMILYTRSTAHNMYTSLKVKDSSTDLHSFRKMAK